VQGLGISVTDGLHDETPREEGVYPIAKKVIKLLTCFTPSEGPDNALPHIGVHMPCNTEHT
jgi:hypothetical protein